MQMVNEKPTWLERLEQESWQAELIVSGVAIYGSLQMPALLDGIVEYSLVQMPEAIHFGLYMLFIYLYLGVNILIICFIVHFVVRTLWIGLIGLNSVFPNGINPEFKTYPRHFMEKILADYPKGIGHVTDMDNFCSVIFGFCASLVLTFLAITTSIVIGLWLYYLSLEALPEGSGQYIIEAIGGLLILASTGIMLMNHKKIKETAFAKKYQYRLHKWLGIITLHIFRKPVTRLSMTFFSNLDMKKYIAWVTGIFLICIVMFFFQLVNGKLIFLFNKEMFYGQYNRTDRMLAENYEEMRPPDQGRILSVLLESDRISGNTMQVFVPIFDNEEHEMQNHCGEKPKEETAVREKQRVLDRQYWLACYQKCHRFYLNDQPVEATVIKHTHPNKGENGIRAYLKTETLREGLNYLKVEKWVGAVEPYRTMQVPFWFEKKMVVAPGSSDGTTTNKQ